MFSNIFRLLRACLVILAMLSWLYGCNNSADRHATSDSSTTSYDGSTTTSPATTVDTFTYGMGNDTASMGVGTDSAGFFPPDNSTDTATAPNEPAEIIKRSATLGISYYKKMRLNETKIFTVYVSVRNGHVQLKKEIRQAEAEQSINTEENDTTAVITQDINVYDRLTVTLEYDTSDFEVKPVHRLTTQRIDSLRTTEWRWLVKAVSTDQRSSNLIVKVDPEPPIEGVDDIQPRNIKVKIVFSFWDMLRSWIIYLGNNPQWTLTTLIIPVIVFLFKRRKKQAKAEQEEGKDESE